MYSHCKYVTSPFSSPSSFKCHWQWLSTLLAKVNFSSFITTQWLLLKCDSPTVYFAIFFTHLQWKEFKMYCFLVILFYHYIDIILLMTSQQPLLKLPILQISCMMKALFCSDNQVLYFFFNFQIKNLSKYTVGQNIWALIYSYTLLDQKFNCWPKKSWW